MASSSQPSPTDGQPRPTLAERFCVLAWNHLQIAPNGTVKMCCVAREDLSEGGRPLNVYRDTFEAIWNGEAMCKAREAMASGRDVAACMRCIEEEASVGVSRRTIQNAYWLKHVYHRTAEDFVAEARAHDWRIADRPHFLQLNMGNLCNLACRMCSSQYSSRIEDDPVHSGWMPAAHEDVARWRNDRLPIAPRPVVGVEMTGCHVYEAGDGRSLRWTAGAARIHLPMPPATRPRALHLELSAATGITEPVRIVINGMDAAAIPPATRQQTVTLPLTALDNSPDITIDILSGVVEAGGRKLGVAIHQAWLERHPTGASQANARTLMRFDGNAGWWGQPQLMFGEMLVQPEKIRRLIFQGGEPLLIKETGAILEHLARAGSTHGTVLEIVSNMTVLPDRMLDLLSRFEAVELGCSIDGIGDDLEYIRYPARWAEVAANIDRARRHPNIHVQFNVAVQAYNMLRITELMRYCDQRGMVVHAHFLVGPYQLSVLAMPPAARRLAMARIEEYLAGDCLPHNRGSAEYMMTFLRQNAEVFYRNQLRPFMLFTNDMDRSRAQSFAAVHPELLAAIEAEGFAWTDEYRHLPQSER